MSMFGNQSAVNKRDVKRIAEAELREAVIEMHQGLTQVIARIAGRMVNDVLAVETVLIPDDDGYVMREFGVPVGAVKAVNLGTDEITVHAAGPSSSAPTNGTGVAVIPAGSKDVVPIGGHVFTIYGKPGERVTVYVFAGAARPVAV